MDVLGRRLTVDEVREIVEGQGHAIRVYRLQFHDRIRTYKDEQLFIEGYDNLELPVKTWYIERFNGDGHTVILTLVIKEDLYL